MAQNIDVIHMEIAAFLRNLEFFGRNKNLKITDKTIELLETAILSIDQFVARAEIISHSNVDDTDFILDLNEEQYELRRHIMCRLCLEQIPLERNDLSSHESKSVHARNLKMHQNNLAALMPRVEIMNNFNQIDDIPLEQINPSYSTPVIETVNNFHQNDGQMNQLSLFAHKYTYSVDAFDENEQRNKVKESFSNSKYAPIGFDFDDSAYLIKLAGIPWTATKAEIQAYFADINILNGINGIHFIIDERKNAVNQAYLQLATRRDYSIAQGYNNTSMDGVYIKITEGDIFEFMKMVTKPGYPDTHNMVRLKYAPEHCNEMAIQSFFPGLNICGIHFIPYSPEAMEVFVKFSTADDVELSLNIMGKKLCDVFVKIYRSTDEQLRFCYSKSNHKLPQYRSQSSLNGSDNLAKIHGGYHQSGGYCTVVVRGFLWCVSPHEIREFFKDVNIINGEAGIQINKDVNMEARFSVATEDDLNKALAHHNQRMGPRFVSVSKLN